MQRVLIAPTPRQSVGAFSSNIDEKKNLEDELRMVGLAAQASETAIAITDAELKIVWSNPALERLVCTKDKRDLHMYSITEALDLQADDTAIFEGAFEANFAREVEISIGDSIYNVEVTPFPPATRQAGTFSVALRDITEIRRRQHAEQAAEREVMMTRAMSKSMEVLTHELRTPLQLTLFFVAVFAGIMGITSMLVQDESLPKETLDLLELVMASSSLLLVLINNLLDVRKCSANMMDEFQLAPISSAGPMKDATGFCRPLATISKVGIELDFGNARHATVMSDCLRLQQVLINLTSNAIKYSSEGSCIRISSRTSTLSEVKRLLKSAVATGSPPSEKDADEDQKVLVMAVSDEGTGIPPGQGELLFRKFSQLNNKDNAKRLGAETAGQPQGTGLGLNLCLTFVQLMNGYIWASNNSSGRGATFSFCLPLVSNKKGKLKHTSSSGESSTSAKAVSLCSHAAQYRVLLVDDTLINRKVFERMLRRVGVGLVTTAESGSKALQELEAGDYDIVISDVQMPEMNGMELTEAIRKSETLPKTPLIIGLTADTSQTVEEDCLSSGMADVIHKPITVAEMDEYFRHKVPALAKQTR